MLRKIGIGLLALSFIGLAGTANATLIGDTVTGEILFGGTTAQGPADAVVGGGVGFNFVNADIDVGAAGADYFNINSAR